MPTYLNLSFYVAHKIKRLLQMRPCSLKEGEARLLLGLRAFALVVCDHLLRHVVREFHKVVHLCVQCGDFIFMIHCWSSVVASVCVATVVQSLLSIFI